MRRTFPLLDRKYISRPDEREETSAAFRCPFTSPTGITSFLRGSSILSSPSLRSSLSFFFCFSSLSSFSSPFSRFFYATCVRTNLAEIPANPEIQRCMPCVTYSRRFAATRIRRTAGGSPLFVRVYRIHRAFSSRPLRNRLITVIYISRRF